MSSSSTIRKPILQNPWPYRWSVLVACATFPLIWVGGLVTTYDAGMAVVDWPSTYGYNLFLYPWQSWIAGPWDLFIEHGHRLMGALVGMLVMGLVVATWRGDQRRWLRGCVVLSLVLVIAQGLLGGGRVRLDARQLAQLHGCVGPVFFAFSMFLVTASSNWWRSVKGLVENAQRTHSVWDGRGLSACWLALGLALMQLLAGSQLRHAGLFPGMSAFRIALSFHLIGAAALAVVASVLAWCLRGPAAAQLGLKWPARLLWSLVILQIVLGCSTWIVNYSWPVWARWGRFAEAYTVQAESMVQSLTVTAHVALGALILGQTAFLVTRLCRVRHTWLASSNGGIPLNADRPVLLRANDNTPVTRDRHAPAWVGVGL